jgi:hypothetical protein
MPPADVNVFGAAAHTAADSTVTAIADFKIVFDV